MLRILLAQYRLVRRYPPVDAQAFVQDADAPVRFRMVEVVALVLEHRRLAQYRKPMREALRDEELPVVVFRQLHRHVLPVRGAALADIHRHIQHRPLHATHQFALRVRRPLEVQPAHHAVARHALVVLYKSDGLHLLIKLPLRERLKEIPSRVSEDAWFDNHHAVYTCLYYVHFIN